MKPIQYVQRFLHLLHPGSQQIALLFQDRHPGFNRLVVLLNEPHVLDQRLNGQPGAAHTLDEFNAPQVIFVVIPDAALVSINRQEQPNTLVVAQGILRKVITLTLLDENNLLPAAICFYTEGVRLAVTGSPVLDTLKSLETKGVHLILCSTCLNFFNLAGQEQVGIVGGMTDIIEAQRRASKVIAV